MLDSLGPSLTDFVKANKGPISLKTVLSIAMLLIGNIKKVHGQGLIHREIRPDALFFARDNDTSKVYFTDFVLAKPYRDEDGMHNL